jgi:hypothetical protein
MNNWFIFILFLISFCLFPLKSNDIPERIKYLDRIENILSLESSNGFYWEYSESNAPFHWLKTEIPSNLKFNFHKNIYYLHTYFHLSRLPPEDLYLHINSISDRDKIYFNNVLIGNTGIFDSEYPTAYDKERIYKIPLSLILTERKNEILIEVQGVFNNESGILKLPIEIGYSKNILDIFYFTITFNTIILVIYLFSGLNFLYLFYRERKQKEFLYYFIFIVDIFIYYLLKTQIKYFFDINLYYLKILEYLSLNLSLPLFYHFMISYFVNFNLPDENINNNYKLYYILNSIKDLLDCILIYISFYYLIADNINILNTINLYIVQPTFLVYSLVALLMLYLHINKYFLIQLVFITTFLLSITVFIDIFSFRNNLMNTSIFRLSFILYIFIMHISLIERYVLITKKWKLISGDLENVVISRTNKLNESLLNIIKVKTSQEADYFLFYQILNSILSEFNNKTKNIEIYEKPYHIFEYRGEKKLIGGDICITDLVFIGGKEFVFLINGDAMGKSLQGAIGALAIGIVVKSYLKENKISNNTSPELWIYGLFSKLNESFECFEETMFASSCISLLDYNDGFYYQVSSEHPKTILLKSDKANFLNNSVDTCKLGVNGIQSQFKILTKELSPGDIIIIGSDGKDEIIMRDENNKEYYNLDENIFLNIVNETKGNLNEIILSLNKKGKIRDDISIIRLEYNPLMQHNSEEISTFFKKKYISKNKENTLNSEEILFFENLNVVFPELNIINKILGLHFYNLNNIEKAILYIKKYNYNLPNSLYLLHINTLINKKIGNYIDAKYSGEQILLRRPKNKKNLNNLISIYKKLDDTKNLNKVNKILDNYKNEIY